MNVLPPFFEHKSLFFQIIFLLFFVVAGSVFFSLAGAVLSSLIWHEAYDAMSTAAQANYLRFNQVVSMLGVWLVPALLFSYGHYKNCWRYSRADVLPSYTLLKWTCLLAIILLPVVYFMAYLNQSVQFPPYMSEIESWMRAKETKAEEMLETLTADNSVLTLCFNLVVMGVMPAVCEEFFFQGTLQPMLTRSLKNNHVAIWLTAFIFSAIHLQFFGFVPRFLLGAYLGYLFVWSGSLWLPVVAHLLHNVCSLLLQYSADRNSLEIENPDVIAESMSAILPVVAVASIVVGYVIYQLWKNRERDFYIER